MIARAQLLFVLLLLPLAACATARLEPGCADNAMCAARAAEPRLLTEGRAERHGDDLVLIPGRGERQLFTDNKQACDADDVDHCTGFALMGRFPKSNAWVVQQFYYEGGDFLLRTAAVFWSRPMMRKATPAPTIWKSGGAMQTAPRWNGRIPSRPPIRKIPV
jgi:hypothetical protein